MFAEIVYRYITTISNNSFDPSQYRIATYQFMIHKAFFI